MTLPTYTPGDITAMSAAQAVELLRQHTNTIKSEYNTLLTMDRGIVYVAEDGADGNAGRSWTLPKATIAGAQAAGGAEALILVGQGSYDTGASIELQDGQLIVGISPHTSFGTVLQATAGLGTDPLLVNTAGNLTSGGLINLQLRGRLDGSGGVGMLIEVGTMADYYLVDRLSVAGFGSHGIHFDIPSGQIAGNPLFWGVISAFGNGLGGAGDGVRLERAHAGTVRFAYIGGDNNVGSLLYLDVLNDQGLVRIDNLKAERTTSGRHDDIVTVNNANGGALSIGGFRLYHNVSGGADGNALIRNTGDATLRFLVDHVFATTAGSNTYTYGFTDGTNTIAYADFIRHPWIWNATGIGLRYGPLIKAGSGDPNGATAAPVGSIFLRTDGGTNTTIYIKESGTGNTGWVPK